MSTMATISGSSEELKRWHFASNYSLITAQTKTGIHTCRSKKCGIQISLSYVLRHTGLFILTLFLVLSSSYHLSEAADDSVYLYDDFYDGDYSYYADDYNNDNTVYYEQENKNVGQYQSDFIPTVIPLIQSRNLNVGPRNSKHLNQNSNARNVANPFLKQVFNNQQVSSNNVPSSSSSSNSQLFKQTHKASANNHHVALNVQGHGLKQVQQNVQLGPNRQKTILRTPTPLQKILQDGNINTGKSKIIPEPGWIPLTRTLLPKLPLGAAGRPIPQTLQQKQSKYPPQSIAQAVQFRNKLQQQNRLQALLKKTKLPSIKFPPISEITGPTPLQTTTPKPIDSPYVLGPVSTISAAFKNNHARFYSTKHQSSPTNNYYGEKTYQQQQQQQQPSPTPTPNRPVVIVTTIRPNVIKQQNVPFTSSSSPSPLIQIVESRSIRPPVSSPHENSLFPLHLNSRRPYISPNSIPITVYPNDTVVIQYQTTLTKLNTDTDGKVDPNYSNGKRSERATLKTAFEDRINLLSSSCKDEVEDLIREILESPLRKRNALLGILRLKKKAREGRNSAQTKQSGFVNQGKLSNFGQQSVNDNTKTFSNQQKAQRPSHNKQNNRQQNRQIQQNKQTQLQNNKAQQKFVISKNNNNFQQQQQQQQQQNTRINDFNTNKNIVNNFQRNGAGNTNLQQTSNRNSIKQQNQTFFVKNNVNQAKTIIRTTIAPPPVVKSTTIRTTRRPKSIVQTPPPIKAQQRAIPSGSAVPAKQTVNEQFQNFPAFQHISAKKKKEQKVHKQDVETEQVLLGSFKPTKLENSNFEQAFLTKVPVNQVQKQQKQNSAQTQFELARQRLQIQQKQRKELKKQSQRTDTLGKTVNNQRNVNNGRNNDQRTSPPQLFIDLSKKKLKGDIFQQIQTQQNNNNVRSGKAVNNRPLFLPGEFQEVPKLPVPTIDKQQNRGNKNLNSQGQFQQNKQIINTPKPTVRKQHNRTNNRNKNQAPLRQNIPKKDEHFGGSNRGNKSKKNNSNNKKNEASSPNNQGIFTTSRPQVTQTFIPRQILRGNNGKNVQTKNVAQENKGTFTIEQFLARYPEVKRLSSRFGGGKNVQQRVVGRNKTQQKLKKNQNGSINNGRQGNKRKQGRKAKSNGNENSNRNISDTRKEQQRQQEHELRKQKSINRPTSKNTRPQTSHTTTTVQPIITTITPRRAILTTTRAPAKPSPQPTQRQPQQLQLNKQTLTTKHVIKNQRPKPSKPTQQAAQPVPVSVSKDTSNANRLPDVNYDDYELSSDDYSYLYYQDYYEELVPVHHRFLQLSQTSSTTTTPKPKRRRPKSQRKKNKKNKNNRNKNKKNGEGGNQNQVQSNDGRPANKQPASNGFSFFSFQPQDKDPRTSGGERTFPNFPGTNGANNNQNAIQPQITKVVTTSRPITQAPKKHVLKPSTVGEPKEKPVAIVTNDPNQSGPFGYVDKGTFFTDSHVQGFPQMIEVIYQGFVWALNMYYPEHQKVKHGGVHTILKDKVKRQKVFLKDGDYIVRVAGRASPYNINRLTFYTAKGKTFGPWGDRRSQDSIDFDVSAPAGHGLAYLSGTVDFGVPFRSISFHWRPHE